jgi:WhiB family redox-sensing transcriptional regulator
MTAARITSVQPLGAWASDPDRACAQPGVNPRVFFATGGTAMVAREICRRCPVKVECAEDAIAHPWVRGIWGDTSSEDRHAIRAARART